MRSMTGFGRSQRDARGCRAVVEVKTVNHKGLDVKLRLPREASVLELEILGHVKGCVERGRVDVSVELLPLDPGAADLASVERLVAQSRAAGHALGARGDINVGDLMRVFAAERGKPVPIDLEAAQPAIFIALDDALAALFEARTAEGVALAGVVEQRLSTIAALTEQLAERTRDAPRRLADKLRARLVATGVELDAVRVVQEAALLADRTDVTEELERLQAHVTHGRHLAGTRSSGRQLEFLCQELLREANTVGSKCQDATAAHLVVELKTEIERLREQVQNIE